MCTWTNSQNNQSFIKLLLEGKEVFLNLLLVDNLVAKIAKYNFLYPPLKDLSTHSVISNIITVPYYPATSCLRWEETVNTWWLGSSTKRGWEWTFVGPFFLSSTVDIWCLLYLQEEGLLWIFIGFYLSKGCFIAANLFKPWSKVNGRLSIDSSGLWIRPLIYKQD